MTVAFDAVGPSSSGTTSATSPLTWTHVCGASATHLLVGATWDGSPDGSATMSATYNGVSMTSLGTWHTGGGTAGFLQVWSLASPATGSHSVSITFTGSPGGVNAGSMSFTGSTSVSAVQSAVSSGSSANPSLTFTGTTSGNIVAAFVGAGSTVTQAGSFTQRYNDVTGSGTAGAGFTAGATIASPGGSTTANWTMGADFWAVAAVEVQGVTGNNGSLALAPMALSSSVTVPAAIYGVGTPVNVHATSGSVTGSWPTGSSQTAGNLLVAVVTSSAATSTTSLSTPSGWTKQIEELNSATAHTIAAVYTKTAAGGDTAPNFTTTLSGTGGMNCMLFELVGANTSSPIDTSGVFASGSSTATLNSATFTATTAGAPSNAGNYGIAVFAQERTAGNLTFTDSGTGWTKLLNGAGVSSVAQAAILVQPATPTSGTLNDHGAFSTATSAFGSAIVVVFKVASTSSITSTGSIALAPIALSGAGGVPTTTSGSMALAPMATAVAAAVPLYTIVGLGGSGTGYFKDGYGNPRLVWGDAIWALMGNAGRWNSGNWQSDFDTFVATRASQGFTVLYGKPIGTTQSGNLDNNGKTFDSLYPFQGGTPSTGVAGANPSTGLTADFWARIDYFLNSCLSSGITVFFNAIGYDSDFSAGPGPLFGKSTTEFQAYGAALGARYKDQPNLVWHLADDYFGENDSLITAFMTGVASAGDTHAVSIENMPESTSRFTLDSSPTTMSWGDTYGDYNFVYSYNEEYYGVEEAYLESSPITVIQGDGYFYQGTSTYTTSFDRGFRQAAWWALASGARGRISGSESIWQWASTAQSSSSTDWWYVNNAKNIRTVVESLPGWERLVPDTSNALVTAGRGTRASAIASGGSGGVYEPAFTNSYVAASVTADKSLALLYLPNHTTITIDQTKLCSGYLAYWVDPITGARTSVSTGSTYNSTTQGTNSQGDPDWVLVLEGIVLTGGPALAPMAMSGSATVSTSGNTSTGSMALAPMALAGTVTETETATGSMALAPMALAGTDTETEASSGSVALAPMALTGSVTETEIVAGSLALAPMALSGSVGQAQSASGSLALPAMAMLGAQVNHYRLMDGASGRPGTGSSTMTPPTAVTSYAGDFQAGQIFAVTEGDLWFEGYWWYVPTGGDTASQTFCLYPVVETSTAVSVGTLISGSTVASGTLTAGSWNWIPLSTPIPLSTGKVTPGLGGTGGMFVATTAWTAVAGFPDTLNAFGTGNPYANGITNGPLTTFGLTNAAGHLAAGSTFGTATNDPTTGAPLGTDGTYDNFWLDIQVTDAAPAGYTGPWSLYPNRGDANDTTVQDSAVNYVVATEVEISERVVVNKLWYYSPSGTVQLATHASVYEITGADSGIEVIGISSPTWMAPDGSAFTAGDGWCYCNAGDISIPAGSYKIAVHNNAGSPDGWSAKDASSAFWDTGEGASGITQGPLSAPNVSSASTAYEFDGSSPGTTPPYTTGVTETGQGTFAMTGPQYPYLYVTSLAQNYWQDLTVTLPQTVTSSGSVALAPMALSGTDTETEPESGSMALAPMALSGSVSETETSSGSEALAPMALAGSGSVLSTGSSVGSIALAPIALAGSVGQTITSTGSIALAPMAMSGAQPGPISMTGTLALAPLALAGSITETETVSGSIALAPLAMQGQPPAGVTSAGSIALAQMALHAGQFPPVPAESFGTFTILRYEGTFSALGRKGSVENEARADGHMD